MRTVNVADLKNHLSRYLSEVREGEEVLIRDRNLPIARIVPLSNINDVEAEEVRLAAAGQLRLPEATGLPKSFWSMPAPRVSVKRAAAAVIADREGD